MPGHDSFQLFIDHLKACYRRSTFPTYFKEPSLRVRPKEFIHLNLIRLTPIIQFKGTDWSLSGVEPCCPVAQGSQSIRLRGMCSCLSALTCYGISLSPFPPSPPPQDWEHLLTSLISLPHSSKKLILLNDFIFTTFPFLCRPG